MIIVDDIRSITVLGIIAAILTVIVAISIEPECPAGSIARHTRSGWFCVVPEIKK
jgi:hypothetical protein